MEMKKMTVYWELHLSKCSWTSVVYSHIYQNNTFIFQLRKYPCNITHDIYIFFVYTMENWYTTDIFRIWMRILQVNATFYDVVNMIYCIITIANPFPDTA